MTYLALGWRWLALERVKRLALCCILATLVDVRPATRWQGSPLEAKLADSTLGGSSLGVHQAATEVALALGARPPDEVGLANWTFVCLKGSDIVLKADAAMLVGRLCSWLASVLDGVIVVNGDDGSVAVEAR